MGVIAKWAELNYIELIFGLIWVHRSRVVGYEASLGGQDRFNHFIGWQAWLLWPAVWKLWGQ